MAKTRSSTEMGVVELQCHIGEVITFPGGMIGFPNWQRFIIEADSGQPILDLVCQDEEDICFLVTSPDHIVEGYEVEISSRDQEIIGLVDPTDAFLLCTLTVKQDPLRVTANLAGPIVVNSKTRLAKQLVIEDERYSLHHPVGIEVTGE